jgi:glucans biosynthesis protein C
MASASIEGRTAGAGSRRVLMRPESARSQSQPDPAKPRYHAFDALRGVAMFLVIGLHAALAYLERAIPGVLWCIRDAPTTPLFDWFCWWCMGVSNPLYFTIAGFFAVGLYRSRGLRGFLTNRAQRVLVPYLIGSVTVLPVCLCAWAYGWLLSERCTWRELLKLRFVDTQLQAERLGSGHLWFLEYLIVMIAIFGAFVWLTERYALSLNPLRTLLDRVLGSPWAPLLLAIPTTGLLWLSRQGSDIDVALDRHNSLLIHPMKLLHHGTFFVVGLGLYRMRHDLTRLSRTGPLYLALSVPIYVARAWLLDRDFTSPLEGPAAWAMAAFGALFAWLVVFGFIGTFLRVFQESRPAIRYLADSSYWIYLVHMPIIGFIQVNLFRIPGHAVWKIPVALGLTLALGFASYQSLVRYTWLGTGLHGRRERPEAASGGAAVPQAMVRE